MIRKYHFLLIIFFVISVAKSEEYQEKYSQNSLGGIGLIQIPSARSSQDGAFVFGVSAESPYNRLFSRVQIFPNLEAVLRYTETTFQPYNSGSEQTWKDKGIDFKFNIIQESELFPAISIGFNDFGGTGAYSSEYVAATKKFNNIDFTLGLGWGRLGGTDHIDNPFSKSENRSFKRGGGRLDIGRLFSGEKISVFSGIEYFTPVDNLSFKIEYDTSDYSFAEGKRVKFDEAGKIFQLDSRINYAISYSYDITESDSLNFNLGYVRGNTLLASFAISTDLNYEIKPKYVSPAETLNKPYLKPYTELNDKWKKYVTDTIFWQFSNVGFVTHNIIFDDNQLIVEISQNRFKKTSSAIDLALRILANNAPKNIEKLTVINFDFGVETLRASIMKDELFELAKLGPTDMSNIDFETIRDYSDDSITINNPSLYPNFFWIAKPHLVGTLQHQERFYFWGLEALIQTEYAFRKGLYFSTDIGIRIDDNFDEYTYHIPDGQLHHVRQDRRLYLTEGKTGMRKAALDYFTSINPNLYAKFSFGYLEWMYGGFGGQLLYKPDNKRWAIGIDSYWVKHREFDQRFSFRDYETVTGFLSYYYDIPFFDMRLKTSIGRFLGKDKGIDIDVSRLFKSGARVGAKMAFTDCNTICVGEGSFNKYIYFTLPMDKFYLKSSTRNNATYSWSPLTKDAGTKIHVSDLFDIVVDASDRIEEERSKNWSPKKIFSGFGLSPKVKN